MHPQETNPSNRFRVSRPASSAEDLVDLLLAEAGRKEYSRFRSILKEAADAVKVAAFGYDRRQTKRRILTLLKEYHCLEIVDITDETRISENEVRSALEELVTENRVIVGKRRRWQEVGRHYNDIFELAKN